MRLRPLTKHIKDQNWFAVAIDFFIVVVGVFMGLQLGNWNDARATRMSERDFLARLHGDIVELQERRAFYDTGRPFDRKVHTIITEFLMGERDDLSEAEKLHHAFYPGIKKVKGLDAALICNAIDWTAALTVPPAVLPTATELVSAGRVNDIASTEIKAAMQSFLQQADRMKDLIIAIEKSSIFLSDRFPVLFEIRSKNWEYEFDNGMTQNDYRCDYEAMRKDGAFLNAFTINVSNYSEYTVRGIIPVSEKLGALHNAVDIELGISHDAERGSD
jgi:hypothetical protein